MLVTFVRTPERIEGLVIDPEATPAPPQVEVVMRGAGGGRLDSSTGASSGLADKWIPGTQMRGGGFDSTPDSQFFPLYLDPVSKDLVLPISSRVTPKIAGGGTSPDVEMRIELSALHLPNEGVRSGTVQIQVSQDGKFTDGRDALTWIVAAGLDFYKAAKDGKGTQALKPGELKADLAKPFIGRPISLPGGAGWLKVDILQDVEKSLVESVWDSVVSLFKTPQGMALAVTVGFPAIGIPAVAFVDQIVEKLRASGAQPVIRGKSMQWAFNKKALDRLQLGSAGVVELPIMNEGFYVLVPAGRLSTVMASKPKYVGGFGYLVPGDTDIGDPSALAAYLDKVAQGDYIYRDLPYAVISVELREADVWKGW